MTLLVLAATALASPTLSLASAGEEPRTTLELTPARGQVETARLTLALTARTKHDGAPVPATEMPPVALDLRAEVLQVTPTPRYRLTVTGVGTEGDDEALREAVAEALQPLLGMTGEITTSRSGIVTAQEWSAVDQVDAAMVDELRKALDVLAQPLPVDAVGVGASWTVTRPDASGFNVVQRETWTLVERDSEGVVLHGQITQEAELGQPVTEGLPEGATGKLARHLAIGEAKVVLGPGRLLPREVQEGMTVKYTVDVATDEQTTQMSSIVGHQLSLTTRLGTPE